jgi:predicted phosphodiesterase
MLLLHLSDIHFKASDTGHVMDHYQLLRSELVKDIKHMFEQLEKPPDTILLTGDIAYAGNPVEYQYATEWLKNLCNEIGADYERIIVVPGNHDADRSISGHDDVQNLHQQIKNTKPEKLYSVLKGMIDNTATAEVLYRSLTAYNHFASQFLCDLFPPDRTTVKRDFFLNDDSTLRITGLNSSFVSSRSDNKRELFVDHAYNQIIEEPGIVNMVIGHHPYGWLRNGDILQRHLKKVAKLQLFGHEHTQRYDMNRDWILLSASAAQPDEDTPDWEPGYNIMDISVEGTGDNRELVTKTYFRIWQENPIAFTAKMDGYNDYFLHKIKLDYWTVESNLNARSTENTNIKALEEPIMASLREVAINYSQLTVSDKTRIAKKLGLFELEDNNYPDFEKYRRVLTRAKDQGLIEKLSQEIEALKY